MLEKYSIPAISSEIGLIRIEFIVSSTSEIFFHVEKSPVISSAPYIPRLYLPPPLPPVLLGDTYLLTSRVMSLAKLELIRRYLRWVDAPTDCAMFAWMLSAFTTTWCIIAITSRRKLYITTSVGSQNPPMEKRMCWNWGILLISILNPFVRYKFLYTSVCALTCKTKRKWSSFYVHESNYEYFPPPRQPSPRLKLRYISLKNVISNQRSFRFRNTRVFDIIRCRCRAIVAIVAICMNINLRCQKIRIILMAVSNSGF